MNKISIHRALAELKLIDSKIEKAISSLNPLGFTQKDKLVNNFVKKEDFDKDAKSKLQSILDLIERKTKVKSSIVNANSVTTVKIAGKSMTIADAINYKSTIEFKRRLVSQLIASERTVKAKIEMHNKGVEESALRLAEAALQKDNVKINDGDAVAITEPFIEKNKFELVDPLGVSKLADEIQKELEDFETEVDAVLSEANAITLIEI